MRKVLFLSALSFTVFIVPMVGMQNGAFAQRIRIAPPPIRIKPITPPIRIPSGGLDGGFLPPIKTLPPVITPPPPVKIVPSVAIPYQQDDNNEVDNYLKNVRLYGWGVTATKVLFIVTFSSLPSLSGPVMRKHIEELYILMTRQMFVVASRAVLAQQKANTIKLSRPIPWQTRQILQRNARVIRDHDATLKRLNRNARREANQRSYDWNRGGNDQRRSRRRIQLRTGPVFRQLQSISISGW